MTLNPTFVSITKCWKNKSKMIDLLPICWNVSMKKIIIPNATNNSPISTISCKYQIEARHNTRTKMWHKVLYYTKRKKKKQNKTKFKDFLKKQTKDNKNIEIEERTNRKKIKNWTHLNRVQLFNMHVKRKTLKSIKKFNVIWTFGNKARLKNVKSFFWGLRFFYDFFLHVW
jgi:hypothetical protein